MTTFPAERLADVNLACFGESVTIERPIQGPIDPITGTRTKEWQGVTLRGNVQRSAGTRIDGEAPIETALVAVRVDAVVYDGGPMRVDETCRVKIGARDIEWRQVVKVDRVGEMLEIETSRKK